MGRSGLAVASHFGKRHADVLQDIDRLREAGGGNLHDLMFQEVRARNERANRETRSFYLDRDGFTLLVMGYTGPLALTFKLAYLRRFNAMEAELRERAARPALPAPSVPGMEQVVASFPAAAQTLRGAAGRLSVPIDLALAERSSGRPERFQKNGVAFRNEL